MENVKWIKEHGKTAKGKQELIRHLEGGKNTLRQAVLGMCYQCCGYFHGDDPKAFCEVDECPLSNWMPYRKDKVKVTRTKKQVAASQNLALLRSGGSKKHMPQELI